MELSPRTNKAAAVIQRWIKLMVQVEPATMRRVLKTPFGDLGAWIQPGAFEFGQCGCLVGTTALCLAAERNTYQPDSYSMWVRSDQPLGATLTTVSVVNRLIRVPNPKLKARLKRLTYRAGIAANRLKEAIIGGDDANEEYGQAEGERLIKQWIRAELRARAARRARRNRRDKN